MLGCSLGAALPEIARTLGIDPTSQDVEPDLTPQPLGAQRVADFGYFIRHDRHDRHDFSAIIGAM